MRGGSPPPEGRCTLGWCSKLRVCSGARGRSHDGATPSPPPPPPPPGATPRRVRFSYGRRLRPGRARARRRPFAARNAPSARRAARRRRRRRRPPRRARVPPRRRAMARTRRTSAPAVHHGGRCAPRGRQVPLRAAFDRMRPPPPPPSAWRSRRNQYASTAATNTRTAAAQTATETVADALAAHPAAGSTSAGDRLQDAWAALEGRRGAGGGLALAWREAGRRGRRPDAPASASAVSSTTAYSRMEWAFLTRRRRRRGWAQYRRRRRRGGAATEGRCGGAAAAAEAAAAAPAVLAARVCSRSSDGRKRSSRVRRSSRPRRARRRAAAGVRATADDDAAIRARRLGWLGVGALGGGGGTARAAERDCTRALRRWRRRAAEVAAAREVRRCAARHLRQSRLRRGFAQFGRAHAASRYDHALAAASRRCARGAALRRWSGATPSPPSTPTPPSR